MMRWQPRVLAFAITVAISVAISGLLFARAAVADDNADLAGGKIVITQVPVSGSSEPQHVMRAIVESPPASVWKIVSDCAHYKEHLPHIAASAELSRVGKTVTCQVTIDMPFPTSNLTAVTEAIHEERPDGMSRTWKLLRGDFEFNEGSWTVESYRGGAASLVTYRLHVKPKTMIPGFIRDMAQAKAMPDLMQRVRLEAAKVTP
jgi:ribosome-associated toxin RatA of RatAB toxin-antitoxin module